MVRGATRRQSHPYGHAKFETFTAAAIALMLGIACYTVGRGAIDSLMGNGDAEVNVASFAIMIGTLAVNLGVTTWEARAGRRLGSEVLMADARHTLSDVLVSSGVIVSLILVKLGFQKADGVLALLVAVAIAYTAFTILRGVGRTLGDAARLPEAEVAAVAGGVEGVVGCHSVRTRGSENRVFVDLHLLVARHLGRARSRDRPRGGDGVARPVQPDRRRGRPRGAGQGRALERTEPLTRRLASLPAPRAESRVWSERRSTAGTEPGRNRAFVPWTTFACRRARLRAVPSA